MKLWFKIEVLLNKIIILISNLLMLIFTKLTPLFIRNKFNDLKTKFKAKIINTKNFFKESIIRKLTNIKDSKEIIITKVKLIIELLQNKIRILIFKINELKKIDFSSQLKDSKKTISTYKNKIKDKKINPTYFCIILSLFTFLSYTSYFIYKELSPILNDPIVEANEVIKIKKENKRWKRSPYLLHEAKVFKLTNVNIPIYVKNRKGMQALKIDLLFITSNRYTSQFFQQIENEYLLRDTINQHLLPVIPSFPMEKEGKKILKIKLRTEVNHLIKRLKINGRIEHVYVNSILNG